MFGIPLDGPARIFCDNEAVYKSTSNPEATLKKKHNAIACHHKARESIAAGILQIAKEDGKTNIADILTNCDKK